MSGKTVFYKEVIRGTFVHAGAKLRDGSRYLQCLPILLVGSG